MPQFLPKGRTRTAKFGCETSQSHQQPLHHYRDQPAQTHSVSSTTTAPIVVPNTEPVFPRNEVRPPVRNQKSTWLKCAHRSAPLLRKWRKLLIGPEKAGMTKLKSQSLVVRKNRSANSNFPGDKEGIRTAAGMIAAPPIPWSARRTSIVMLSV